MAIFEFKEVPRQSVLSTKHVYCTVSTFEAGIPADPTSGVISFAFLTTEVNPVSGDWKAGSWETAGTEYWGRCFIGPNGGVVALTVGTYDVWVRVVKGIETVIEQVGKLTIY